MIAIVGDVHGHLQLACAGVASWQEDAGESLEAVFLCGDVGTFTRGDQLDSATRRHARANPCELEFMHQWMAAPTLPWIDGIFTPLDQGGLGLSCPLIMVAGNHEGFAHLSGLAVSTIPGNVVQVQDLPAVDPGSRLRFLPSGWRVGLPSGVVAGCVGGIEPGQRTADYHPMAYVDEEAVLALCQVPALDILITHQGPSQVQGALGSQRLQFLLDEGPAPGLWFHGHATPHADPVTLKGGSQVIPLGDIAFSGRDPETDQPGADGWALVTGQPGELSFKKEPPPNLRALARRRWVEAGEGLLVCPQLARWAWGWG